MPNVAEANHEVKHDAVSAIGGFYFKVDFFCVHISHFSDRVESANKQILP
jgi:hypothetical protein